MTQLYGDTPTNADECIGSFSVYRNAALEQFSGGVIIFDAEEWDTSGWFASPKFTPQEAGIYRISGRCEILDTVTYVIAVPYKNGAAYMYGEESTGSAGNYTSWFDVLVSMNGSTDYLEMGVLHSSGIAQTMVVGSAQCYMQGSLVGRI